MHESVVSVFVFCFCVHTWVCFLCVFLCLCACISVCMCAYVRMQHLQEAGTRVGVLGLVPRVGTSMLFLEVTFFCFKDVLGLSDRPWNITTVSLNAIPLTQFLLTVHINTPPSDTLPISILIPRYLWINSAITELTTYKCHRVSFLATRPFWICQTLGTITVALS